MQDLIANKSVNAKQIGPPFYLRKTRRGCPCGRPVTTGKPVRVRAARASGPLCVVGASRAGLAVGDACGGGAAASIWCGMVRPGGRPQAGCVAIPLVGCFALCLSGLAAFCACKEKTPNTCVLGANSFRFRIVHTRNLGPDRAIPHEWSRFLKKETEQCLTEFFKLYGIMAQKLARTCLSSWRWLIARMRCPVSVFPLWITLPTRPVRLVARCCPLLVLCSLKGG